MTTFRVLADDQEFEGDELFIKLASDTGRAAGVDPRVLMRAVIRKLALRSMREVSISAADSLYSEFGDLGPGSMFPPFTYGDLGRGAPDMTADTKATPIVPLYGYKGDRGAIDPLTGHVNPKGRIPLTYLGKFTFSGLSTPPATSGRTLAAAVALMQGLVDADADDATWASTLGFDIGSSDIVNLKAIGTVPDTYDRLAAIIGGGDLEAVLAQGTTAAPGDGVWGILAGGVGPWYLWESIFGSDLGGGDPQNKHDRTELDILARAGSDLLVPGDGKCPWNAFSITNPDTGRVFELAAIGARGPLLDDHLNGVVNLTANAWGLVGPNGYPIGKAMDAIQHAYENFFLEPKSAGPWVTTSTAPKWSDGTPKCNSKSFAARQALTATALGGDGLLAAWYPDKQAAKVEWMVRFQEWTESKLGTDAHGQLRAFALDPALDTSAWPVVRHETDVFGQIDMWFGEDRENVVTGVCDYDPDTGTFNAAPITEKNLAGIRRYKNREKPGDRTLENALIDNPDHLRWLLQQRAARLGLGVRGIRITGTRAWLDTNLGRGILFNSDDGPGASGYVNHPFIVLRRKFSFDSQLVTYTLWDVRDALLSSRFTDGLSRLSAITDTDAAAAVVTDDDDVAALVLA